MIFLQLFHALIHRLLADFLPIFWFYIIFDYDGLLAVEEILNKISFKAFRKSAIDEIWK